MNEISENSIQSFLSDANEVLIKYAELSTHAESAGFNVFTMISDMYYRENFHSDIIASFLDPHGAHGEGDLFLKVFLRMLNIPTANYTLNTTVKREYYARENNGKIDILIKNNEPDPENRHCVIIENKLNDAKDMVNQLSRYNNQMMNEEKYKVDAIVYLPLSPDKKPSDIDKLDNTCVHIIPVNSRYPNSRSLVGSWITPSIELSNNIDSISILRQYKRLLVKTCWMN